MDEKYWDTFEDDCLNVFRHDTRGLLREILRSYVLEDDVVGDFGCGTGRAIPLLAGLAEYVYAVDLSQRNLDLAQRNCEATRNVEFSRCDLVKGRPRTPDLDALLAVNVLILADRSQRHAILANMRKSLEPGGHLVLVVPSLESQLWSYQNLLEHETHQGSTRNKAVKVANRVAAEELSSIAEGIVCLSGTDTKFYLGPEIDVVLADHGFDVIERRAIEYGWEEELLTESWHRRPGPWHWIVVARRSSSRTPEKGRQ
jgi:SAM-dependent methyltransferase